MTGHGGVRTAIALAALWTGACGGNDPSTGAAPDVRLVELTELDAAAKRHLERGGLIALWATW